ncbi:MAG: right-handed parallel beta-helix repeat-containing protein, partial [Planctomycetia bacterium]|nr:right-handed parallel beta-helix repeat-containing protein [Planctomycetia bacterium]
IGLTANISGNTVAGQNTQHVNGQNGIQIGFGGLGHVSNNIVSGNHYDGPLTDGATGILLFQAAVGTTVDSKMVTNNEVGVANDGSSAAMTNNTLSGNSIDGIQLFHNVTGTTITGNFIQNNGGQGVYIDSSTAYTGTLAIQSNSITGNAAGGLQNSSTIPVNATDNWWGSATGPNGSVNSYSDGTGQAVTGNVTVAPWLTDGTDTQPGTPGFQPDNNLFAPITNNQGGQFSTIQAAIDGTTAGGIITLANGTYHESNIHVTKSLTIQGASQGGVILGPSVIDSHDDSRTGGASASQGFIIQSSDVAIEQMTIDGNANAGLLRHELRPARHRQFGDEQLLQQHRHRQHRF